MYHLAQINIGRIRAPLTEAVMADFVNNLDPINALAEAHPGFVWRLQSDAGNATSYLVFDDEDLLLNMSVWTSVAALRSFTYETQHREFLRRRKEWFLPLREVYTALWWIPADQRPTPQDGRARLEHLQQHGPAPFAFSFKHSFPPPA